MFKPLQNPVYRAYGGAKAFKVFLTAYTESMRHRRLVKSQSAMEYLMTYGWAILIIAVVLGALFQLGVFSGIGTPKAQPGNCQVVRVGSGITQTVSLAGECQGQQPEYVAQFNGGYVTVNPITLPVGAATRTVTLWYLSNYAEPQSQVDIMLGYGVETNGEAFQLWEGNSNPDSMITSWSSDEDIPPQISKGTWYFFAFSYNGVYQQGYVGSGGQITTAGEAAVFNTQSSQLVIGAGANGGSIDSRTFIGDLANIQIYNATLSQAEITALYQEGIGGAPIRTQNIVGWWPLNGNAQDYSGNNNNGQPTGITYSSQWTSGYTAP